MNPKVAAMAKYVGFDAAEYTWFDFSDVDKSAEDELQAIGKQHGWDNKKIYLDEFYVPSDCMAIIQPQLPEVVFTYDRYIKLGEYEGAAIMMWPPFQEPIPWAVVTEKAIKTTDGIFQNEKGTNIVLHQRCAQEMKKQGMSEKDMYELYEQFCISAVNYACLINLRAHTTEQTVTAHTAKGLEYINRKRRAKRQGMLYSWNTIELKPEPQVKRVDKGGTHASPARHKRRAHMRRLRTGGFTWIPEMWVGKIENGLIVHDYVADRELTTKAK